MLGFLVSSTAWSWKADWELLGNEYRTDICTQQSWGQVDFVLPDGVEVCSLLEWRCDLWSVGVLSGSVEVCSLEERSDLWSGAVIPSGVEVCSLVEWKRDL